MSQKKVRSKAGVKSKRAGRGAPELERYEKGLEAFERALKTLYKGEVEKAKEQFERLKESFVDESDVLDRIGNYLAVCERKLAPQRKPKTTEETVTYGLMLLNDGDSQQAVKYLSKALEMEPSSAHIEYCLAAALARSGDASEAAKHLKQAIQRDPLNRIHAKTDDDFAGVREQAEVAELLSAT